MKLSHILYKVDNLEKEVKKWQEDGFIVEYGKKHNPYNALIYFKEGPFIELFTFNGLPKFINTILILLGRRKFVEKMEFWANHPEGLLSIVLENYDDNLDKELAILKEHDLTAVLSNKVRIDTKNRKLKFKVAFVNDINFPDLMTYFSLCPKPKINIHPNNILGVESIAIGLDSKQKEIFNLICDDEKIKVFEGKGIKDLKWLK